MVPMSRESIWSIPMIAPRADSNGVYDYDLPVINSRRRNAQEYK